MLPVVATSRKNKTIINMCGHGYKPKQTKTMVGCWEKKKQQTINPTITATTNNDNDGNGNKDKAVKEEDDNKDNNDNEEKNKQGRRRQ